MRLVLVVRGHLNTMCSTVFFAFVLHIHLLSSFSTYDKIGCNDGT